MQKRTVNGRLFVDSSVIRFLDSAEFTMGDPANAGESKELRSE